MPDDQNTELRQRVRANVFLTAVLLEGANSTVVRVRNISPIGAMIEGDNLPAKGSEVRLERGSLRAAGTVVRQLANARGIRFDDPIEVSEWVKRTGHIGQRQVDNAIATLRSGTTLNAKAQPTPCHSIGELLDQLQGVCERVVTLPDLSTKVAEALVEIEAIRVELASRAREL